MRGIATLCVLGMLSIIVPIAPAETVVDTPEFRIGDQGAYVGDVNYTIDVLRMETTVDKAGRSVEVMVVRIAGSHTDEWLISPNTGLTEARRFGCQDPVVENCKTQVFWIDEGTPAIFGASVLQGRDVHPGDAWDLPPCALCTSPIHAEIVAPDADSPLGTAYVLDLNATYRGSGLFYPNGRLHMGSVHAFPLKVELDGFTADLVSFRPGEASVRFTSPPDLPFHPIVWEIQPLEGGYLPEGTPMVGFDSFADARAEAGISGGPPGTLVQTSLGWGERWSTIAGTKVVTQRTTDWTLAGIRPEQNEEVEVKIFSKRTLPDHASLPRSRWEASEATYSDPRPLNPPCETNLAPYWDATRHVLSLGLLEEFQGFSAFSASCRNYELHVFGPPRGFVHTAVAVDLRTGYLTTALLPPITV